MKISRLIVDDRRIERNPRPGTIIYTTAYQAIAGLIENKVTHIEELCLDHVLGEDSGEKIDIRPFVRELEYLAYQGNPILIDRVYIHTSNGSGKEWIYAAFKNRIMAPHYPLVYKVSDEEIGLCDSDITEGYSVKDYTGF